MVLHKSNFLVSKHSIQKAVQEMCMVHNVLSYLKSNINCASRRTLSSDSTVRTLYFTALTTQQIQDREFGVFHIDVRPSSYPFRKYVVKLWSHL